VSIPQTELRKDYGGVRREGNAIEASHVENWRLTTYTPFRILKIIDKITPT
jgi:hypothetical protein